MTRQEIYDSVVQLTADIKKTGVAEKIIEAAKTGDPEKVESVFEKFKEENADLNARIAKLYELRNYKEDSKIEVFGDDEGYFTFDPNIIDPLNFEILTFFIGIDDFDLIHYRYRPIESSPFVGIADEPNQLKHLTWQI